MPPDIQVKSFVAEAIGHLMDCIVDKKEEESILVSLYEQFELTRKSLPQLPDRFQTAKIIERTDEDILREQEEMKRKLAREVQEKEEQAKALLAKQLKK